MPTPPEITSSARASGAVGNLFTFLVQASGDPHPAFFATHLPGFLTLTDNQDGTATLTGTPTENAGVVTSTDYDVVITAINAIGIDIQQFTFVSVEAPDTPQTAVTPRQLGMPTGSEIAVPFRIDPATGGVAVVSNYVSVMEQHLATIINTAVNERVMRLDYGTIVPRAVFAPITEALILQITNSVQQAVRAWEPAVVIQSLRVAQNPAMASAIDVKVQFSLAPLGQNGQLTVTFGGPVIKEFTQ